ncbi:MAG: chromosomal replication initiator protein DnaA [Candidatus Parcubacteria bacterium]|jgi:chromosomal replication initiator protein
MISTVINQNLWDDSLKEIENSISSANFNTWFKETFLIKIDDGVVYVGVPNAFIKEWISKKFYTTVLKTLRDKETAIRSVDFVIAKIDKKKQESKKERTAKENNTALPLSEFVVNKEDNLNPRYTFDSFVIGPFNELAYAASWAIIKNPGVVYNPLFIHGSTGHGKTHLIQAVGNQIKMNFPNKRVFYLTSEKFMHEYMFAVQNNKVPLFKEKYRKYDVLIMDDIQFLSNKKSTQEELFHLFNSLYENNKQIVFSSDIHPNFIQGLEDRLKSRFSQGMIIDIPPPDNESRVQIIKKKSALLGVFIEDQIIEFLAESIEGNIRELEGVVNVIACQSQVKNRPLTLNEIKDLIKNTAKPKKMVSVTELIKLVAEFYGLTSESLCDKTRRKEVVRPRQIAMYILREDFNISFPTIGEKMGGRDHTTVIHSCEKVKGDLKVDKLLEQQINEIRNIL